MYSFQLDLIYLAVDIVFLDAFMSSATFTAFLLVSGVLFWRKIGVQNSGGIEADTNAIIPTYKDSEILERSVKSLLESDNDELSITIVCESDDEEGIERAEKLSENESVEYLINRYESSKAGALNYAVDNTDSDYLAFFDADQLVPKEFISASLYELQDHDIVQGRNLPEPKGLIESIAYYESIIFDHAVRQILYLFTDFRLVASRSTVVSRECFEDLDGFSEDMLTEDFDFAHKCYRNHMNVKDMTAYPVKELAAESFRDWWGQRKRWMSGYVEVFHDLLLRLEKNNYRSFLSATICFLSILGSVLMLTMVSKFLILFIIGSELAYILPLTASMILALLIRLKDYNVGNTDSIGFEWALTPAMFPLFSAVTLKAIMEYLIGGKSGWYRVEKNS